MSSGLERYVERHARLADVVMAVALGACTVFGAQISTPESAPPQNAWPARILAVVAGAAVLYARAHPRPALVVTAAVAAVLTGLGYLPSPLLLAPVMAALYWLDDLTDSRTARRFGYATMALLMVTSLSAARLGDQFLLRTFGTALWLLLPLSMGGKNRLRRAYLDAVTARAAHAERTREEEARARVAEERMRIARELHDVVAHHMAVANAQAGTAAHLAESHPEQARKILAELAGTTSAALLELRATVGVLRQADDPDSPEPSLEPSPGLDRLPELVAGCRSAGLEVSVAVEGEVRPLLPGVDLTAYRIVQEALTNVTRHGGGSGARVRLGYGEELLRITVTDEGAEGLRGLVGGEGAEGRRGPVFGVGSEGLRGLVVGEGPGALRGLVVGEGAEGLRGLVVGEGAEGLRGLVGGEGSEGLRGSVVGVGSEGLRGSVVGEGPGESRGPVAGGGAIGAAAPGGFGLIGMRERAHSVGGELRAGPREGGGFEVAAVLPVHFGVRREGVAPP
ncbi:histidine kinase [Streptomyces sp. NPDC047072]|uniref:histidine kinase n=1 Tax=Streptomyces sp. NPDC047072 TaxID=3154809 RepID=UPI0033DF0A8C